MILRIAVLASVPLILASTIESGREFEAAQYLNQKENGKRGYITNHQNSEGVKGHHNKENQKSYYDQQGGQKKGQQHQDGYYGKYNEGRKGAKGYHYEDHGKYAKGHSTKGHHNVHKLNEYKKNTDFFDENNDENFEQRHGGHEIVKAIAHGNQNQKGRFQAGFGEGKYKIGGFLDKGQFYQANKGHNNQQGLEKFFKNGANYGQSAGQDQFKNFGFVNYKKQAS